MSKKSLIVFLLGFSALLLYLIWNHFSSELRFRRQVQQSNERIKGRLDTLRRMQMAFRDMSGRYAGSFSELFDSMRHGRYYISGRNAGDTLYGRKQQRVWVNPLEHLFAQPLLPLEMYAKIPPGDSETFQIRAGSIEQNQVQIPVFEIREPHTRQPNTQALAIGDMNKAVTHGNWK